jgi:signal transduction histidine kinase
LIDETVQPEFVRLYTVDRKGAASLRGRLDHRPEPQPVAQVALDTKPDPSLEPLTGALHDADFVTSAHDPGHGSSSGADASSSLRALGGALAIPMRLEGRLVGVIIIGRKRAGGHHSGDDLELLRTISDQLSIALENAHAYDTIDLLNQNLEVKNVALLEANRELRDLENAHAYDTIDLLNQNLELKNVALLEANRELREAQAELVQKERLAAIGMLSGAVAHGIRSPLAGIRAAAQLALLDLEGHAAAPTITDVVSETDRLNDRIEALLDFSKPFQPDPRSMPLSDVAARAVHDMRPKATERDVEIVLEEAPKLPQARIDPVLFEQAIAELISNAIDASPTRSEVVVRTGHRSEADGSVIWLEVQDAGPGLPGEDSDRLFDLFFTTKPAGTGFGLATVKKIAEGHGGKILAYNGRDGGACFRIVLPVQSRDAASA